jgi:RNA polymerase sigma factor (sigma-70 family)
MLTQQECNELYRKHAPGAFRRAQRLLGAASDADDVVQDVFVSLFEHYERYRGQSQITTYLYSAVTHACLNRLRNRRKRALLLRAHAFILGRSHDPGLTAEVSVCARDLLQRLPEPLAEVAVYHFVDELSRREIAAVLGCSHTHVGELIARLTRWAEHEEVASCGR